MCPENVAVLGFVFPFSNESQIIGDRVNISGIDNKNELKYIHPYNP
jgi:hypothetical protein